MKISSVAFMLVYLVSSPAFSEEIRVPEDYPTIKFAVEASVPGDTILIGPGEYQEFDLVCDSISLVGSVDGNGNPITTIDSTGLSRSVIFNGTSGAISNVKFKNFTGTAIDCGDEYTSSLSVNNCRFEGEVKEYSAINAVLVDPVVVDLGCAYQCDVHIDNVFLGDSCGVEVRGYGCGAGTTLAITNSTFFDSFVFTESADVEVQDIQLTGPSNVFTFYTFSESVVVDNVNSDLSSSNVISVRSFNTNSNSSVQISRVTGAVSLSVESTSAPVVIEDSNIEGLTEDFRPGIRFEGLSRKVQNTTISNSHTGITNNSPFPFTLESSVVCGNEINIDGPYDSVGSFVLPNCGSFLGACCVNDQCESVIQEDCDALGGSWRGTNTLCTSSLCAPPVQFGICCINGTAISLFDTDCSKVGGSFFGPGDPEGFACPESCEEDINSDQTVDYEDLISVISAWGPCAG